MEKREFHPIYGEIKITINSRARNIILRAREGIIEVTLPPRASRADLLAALDRHGEKLLGQCRANTPATIDGSYKLFEEKGSYQPCHIKITVHPLVHIEEMDKHEQKEAQAAIEATIRSAL